MTPDTTNDAVFDNARLRRALASLRMRYANLLTAWLETSPGPTDDSADGWNQR
ncbi:MAG: hypothetical protein ACRDS9_03295 [Pseudonocardiaceae bacterium]